MATTNHDEYTDYSCSTPIERLARDVETLLREWHVANTDRHVSFITPSSSFRHEEAKEGGDNNNHHSNRSKDSDHVHHHLNTSLDDSTINSSDTWPAINNNATTRQQLKNSNDISNSVRLIRSSRVSLTIAGGPSIGKTIIPLTLSLWDGPSSSFHGVSQPLVEGKEFTTATTDTTTATTSNHHYHHDLPQSLQRFSFDKMNYNEDNNDVFDNFSSLFGIGQHITLTPDHLVDNENETDNYTEVIFMLYKSIVARRHSNKKTNTNSTTTTSPPTLVVSSVLSSLLQTALNCASSHCLCRIPVFGLWGSYNPSISSSSLAAATSESSLQQRNSSNIHNLSSSGGLVLPKYLTKQPLDMKNLQSLLLQDRSSTKSLFSSTSNKKQRREEYAMNSCNFIPPIICANLVSSSASSSVRDNKNHHDDNDVIIGANFSLAILPYKERQEKEGSQPGKNYRRSSRLNTWGKLLLQHSQQPTNKNNNNIDLWGARHTYTWSKKPRRCTFTQQQQRTIGGILFSDSGDDRHYVMNIQYQWRRNNISNNWKDGDGDDHEDTTDKDDGSIESYRHQCRKQAFKLLEEAAGVVSSFSSDNNDPVWGPADDPISSVHVKVIWNGRNNNNGDNDNDNEDEPADMSANDNIKTIEPLLMLPLRVRSRHKMTKNDLIEMEESVENAILNPYQPSLATFTVQVQYDRETTLTTLATNQRLVLASLIRTAVLHPDTLIQHTTNESVMDEWSMDDNDVETKAVLEWLCNHANIGSVTKTLVDAMSWANVADDMIEQDEADDIVRKVLDGTLNFGFPSPHEDIFAQYMESAASTATTVTTPVTNGVGGDNGDNNDITNKLCQPLQKSAAAGRLLSVLFVRMARTKSASSMSLVWLTFVQELRNRWDLRESLPNMGHIPGLDPPPDVLAKTKQRCYSTIGLKARFAAFMHCSEPDPDDNHCLIGQKLQVFNLCVESKIAMEILEIEKLESQQPQDQMSDEGFDNSGHDHLPTIASADAATNRGEQDSRSPTKSSYGIDGQRGGLIVDGLPPPSMLSDRIPEHKDTFDSDDDDSDEMKTAYRSVPFRSVTGPSLAGRSMGQSTRLASYYDATEGRSVMGSVMGATVYDDAVSCIPGAEGSKKSNSVPQSNIRTGARCPVHGQSLIASGDQLYAPYLHRPLPLTDDVILERRVLLSRRGPSGSTRSRQSISDKKKRLLGRIEIAQRLQKPKLRSDMSAFKAANPGAVFQDFINWYGNPGSPLDDYKDAAETNNDKNYQLGQAASRSAAVKLDNASEAMQVLTATRDFWSDTWDEALPCPAVEQQPLYDVNSTVEMILDHLETMHPASLISQVMSVNMAVSYFLLASSAADSLKVGIIQKSFQRLRRKTEVALGLLSRDVTIGTCPGLADRGDAERLPKHASSEAIAACEIACDALAKVEALLSRSMTLLHKFPGQYDLVNMILRRAEGEVMSVNEEEGRKGILGIIQSQQLQQQLSNQSDIEIEDRANSMPIPTSREYLLRNQDNEKPCQLCVRIGEGNTFSGGDGEEGRILLALAKCYHD